ALIEQAGVEALPLGPGVEASCARLNISKQSFVSEVAKDGAFYFKNAVLPFLEATTEVLWRASQDADVIITSTLGVSGRIVAEARNLPHVYVKLQPGLVYSPYDPPVMKEFPSFRPLPQTEDDVAFNKREIAMMHAARASSMASILNGVRAGYGLAPIDADPINQIPSADRLALGLFSNLLAPIGCENDVFHVVGPSLYDKAEVFAGDEKQKLLGFLDAGAPPIVFTLGSLVSNLSSSFHTESFEAASKLEKRMIFLTGGAALDIPSRDDVLVLDYAPYSMLLPAAESIVHHGGVGTAQQALASACPQVIVPHLGDQHDNAARVARLGAGVVIRPEDYNAGSACDALRHIRDTRPKASLAAIHIKSEQSRQKISALIARLLDTASPQRRRA
ncbi:MAG: glycosyltransferase, partial [Caulobacterales bacterium]